MAGEEKVALELKEIEGLLQAGLTGTVDDEEEEKGFKKYVKLVLPHVALVVAVSIYAVSGAFIFQSIESPNEDQARKTGIEDIDNIREQLISMMWNQSRLNTQHQNGAKNQWIKITDEELDKYTMSLYKAFKHNFVIYLDVRVRREEEKEEKKLWTTSAAIFFAATTMATIGYGNIVPVTSKGRVLCVCFALLGAPLAIITIGDLGKFLSECTIHLYKQLKRLRAFAENKWRDIRGITEDSSESGAEKGEIEPDKKSQESDELSMGFSDLITDKTQVPVLLVFAILLVYIALGAFLFAILEGWSYVNSFYFCFITLTTVGFGDLVPEQHQYIVIMLLYIGIGLAVTTMCIDLVGIQYIQKIHYFGRKFRGTDLLQMLKRRRALERQFALSTNKELIQAYLEKMENPTCVYLTNQALIKIGRQPPPPLTTSVGPQWRTPSESVYSTPKDTGSVGWEVDNVETPYEIENEINETMEQTPSPMSTPRSVRQRALMYYDPHCNTGLSSPSGPDISFHCSLATSPSVDDRLMMFDRMRGPTRSSWTESGPDISIGCTISTPASEYEREANFNFHWLRSPSASSFKFTFPLDLAAIAKAAKECRRVRSCPDRIVPPSPPSPLGLSSMELWSTFLEMEEQYSKIKPPEVWIETPPEEEEIGPPSLISSSEEGESMLEFPEVWEEDQPIFHGDNPVYSHDAKPVDPENALQSAMSCPVKYLSKNTPKMVTENYCFVVDGKSTSIKEITETDKEFWKPTSKPVRYYYSEDMKTFEKVQIVLVKGQLISARRRVRKPNGRIENKNVPLEKIFRVTRAFSHWFSCSKFHKIISIVNPVTGNTEFQTRVFVQYLWRGANQSEKLRVSLEYDQKMKKRGDRKQPTSKAMSLQSSPRNQSRRQTLHSFAATMDPSTSKGGAGHVTSRLLKRQSSPTNPNEATTPTLTPWAPNFPSSPSMGHL